MKPNADPASAVHHPAGRPGRAAVAAGPAYDRRRPAALAYCPAGSAAPGRRSDFGSTFFNSFCYAESQCRGPTHVPEHREEKPPKDI